MYNVLFYFLRYESPSQVFFIILTWLQAMVNSGLVSADKLESVYLAYDNNYVQFVQAHSGKEATTTSITNGPCVAVNTENHRYVSGLKNHKSELCHTLYSPQQLKERNPTFNTQAGEQTFAWMGKYKHIVCAMSKTHHLVYLHRMVRRRNLYTEKCYSNGRKPILPKIRH